MKENERKPIMIGGILLIVSILAIVFAAVERKQGKGDIDEGGSEMMNSDTMPASASGSETEVIGDMTDKRVYDGLRHQTTNRVWNMNSDENREFLTSILGFEPHYGGSAGVWFKEQIVYLFETAKKWYSGEYSSEEAAERAKLCPKLSSTEAGGTSDESAAYDIYAEDVDICTIEYAGIRTDIDGTDVWLDLICFLENEENTEGRISAVKINGDYKGFTPNFLFTKVSYDAAKDRTVVWYMGCTAASGGI